MSSKYIVLFVVLLVSAYANGKPTNSNYENATMPPECNKNYCFQQSEDYPADLLDGLLYEFDKIISEDADSITDRIGDNADSDCQQTVYNDPIYEIIDENDRVRYVVQSKKFQQVIRVEECVKPGRLTSDSKHFSDAQLEFIHLSCTNIHIDYSFLVLSLDGTKMETAKAKGGIPVYCTCKLLGM